MQRALFIGRFQPFHKGHHHAITTAAEEYTMVLGIGSAATSHTPENPLTAGERREVITACCPDAEIREIPDQHDGERWMDVVEERIEFDLCISGNDYVRSLFAGRGHPVEHPAYFNVENCSGSIIRECILAGKSWQDRIPGCAVEPLDRIGFAERVKNIHDDSTTQRRD